MVGQSPGGKEVDKGGVPNKPLKLHRQARPWSEAMELAAQEVKSKVGCERCLRSGWFVYK
jgi:hypothetical protein